MIRLLHSRLIIVSYLLLLNCGFLYTQEGGYVSPFSVGKGDTIRFYLSTSYVTYNINIYRWGKIKELITTTKTISGEIQTVSDSSFWYGCRWKESFALQIPQSWQSGTYIAEFPCSTGEKGIVFVVREDTLGIRSKIAILLSSNTWQAYNNYGGKSLYEFNSTDLKRSYKVTFDRPMANDIGTGEYFYWERTLFSWLEKENIPYEVVTGLELYRDSTILSHYNVLCVVGHSEYWSKPERVQVDRFLGEGGCTIILSGNTCWWQVRFEDDGHTMVCFKDKSIDPLNGYADSLVTVNWYASPVNLPENLLTGVSWRNGGYVNHGIAMPKDQGYGDYAVCNSRHWIYRGTGLKDGDEFGWASSIVGYEVDGALFSWQEGWPVVNGTDQTPMNYQILGLSPAAFSNGTLRGHATMGMYQHAGGGWLFNAATTNWVEGLLNDSAVSKITRNLIYGFATKKFPPEITYWSPFELVSDSANHDLIQVKYNEILALSGDTIRFNIRATDNNGGTIQYIFQNNGLVVGTDSNYSYVVDKSQDSTVVTTINAIVSNANDTASIGWTVYHKYIKIISSPIFYVICDHLYEYKVIALHSTTDSIMYTLLEGPPWLTATSEGVISGTAPHDTGHFHIILRTTDQHNHSDTQEYDLQVIDTLTWLELTDQIRRFRIFQNYPNPFNSATTIDYELQYPSIVKIEIYDIIGRLVRVLIADKDQQIGYHNVKWSGEDNNGMNVGTGIYIYRIVARSSAGDGLYECARKMILIK